jgi:hypothetical protein
MAKATFGTLCTAKVKYVIVRVKMDNTLKYVTDVSYSPKEVHWEDGKKAYFWESKVQAEDICLGLNANGYGTFVMEIPDYFDDDNFQNVKK